MEGNFSSVNKQGCSGRGNPFDKLHPQMGESAKEEGGIENNSVALRNPDPTDPMVLHATA